MEGEWHTLHRIEEVLNLICFLRKFETNTITRTAMRCSNRDDLLNLSFILRIPIFSEVFLPSRIYMLQRLFCENCQWVLTQKVIQEIIWGSVEASLASLRGLGGLGTLKNL